MPLLERQIAELFRLYGHMVFRRALRILGGRADADEATQEVFVLVIRAHIDAVPDNPVAWLYTVTTRHCLNALRNRKRRRVLMDERTQAGWGLPPQIASAADVAQLRAILSRADKQQARAATYVFLDGMTHREAGEVMGISKSSVTNLITRLQKAVQTWN
jgi:RNA polymerase sigma-70 factor, ECF subfamily